MSEPFTFIGLSYLATPYSKFAAGLEAAWIESCVLAARLLRAGIVVYSPIAHTHPLAIHGNIDPLDHSIWLPFDGMMMAKADRLIVAHMEGWDSSKGIAHEVDVFMKMGKSIWDLDPETLSMAKRK